MPEPRQIFSFAYFKNYHFVLSDLASMASTEPWSFTNDTIPTNAILDNYFEYTFRRLKFENKIYNSSDNKLAGFNTGLMTSNFEYISAFFEVNMIPGASNPYYFKRFYTNSDISISKNFPPIPEAADYFKDPTLLIYNPRASLSYNVEHIVDDNIERFPESIKANRDMCRRLLAGALEETIKRLRANYKIAVPHCYQNRIQLLIPLYLLSSTGNPDLALAIEKIDKEKYFAITCLTMRMAYQNARLIVKPESSWLVP